MPELPEVEVIIRELAPQVTGEVITKIKPYWHKTVVDSGFSTHKKQIENVTRHGKYILFQLNGGVIIVHLRMTGQLILKRSLDSDAKHLRACIYFDSGNILHFYDSRKFGRIYLTDNPQEVLVNTGIDALDKDLNSGAFINIIQKKKGQIKSLLLNQKNIAGLGNIYIDESLFAARIHPLTRVYQLKYEQIEKLYKEIQRILRIAIKGMGTTISDYKTAGGGFGGFQNQLHVYGRADKPCTHCGTSIAKIRVNNRGTHFCPNCQPVPKT
jgi:formamidopyrimidine-DNA glycosylase